MEKNFKKKKNAESCNNDNYEHFKSLSFVLAW
jgi:hypothetical protein